MSDFEAIVAAYEEAGGNASFLRSTKVASLVVSGNEVVGANSIPGVTMQAEQLPDGVKINLTVEPGTRVELPIHLCFGVLPAEGVQRILDL